MSFEAVQALLPELGQGERLLWSDRPAQGLRLRAEDVLLIPFSLFWGGIAFSSFYSSATSSDKTDSFSMIFAIPFALVAIYVIIGRFFADSYRRSRTWYGVTDQRVVIVSGIFSRQVKSLRLEGINEITLSERKDRRGTITFGGSPAAEGTKARKFWSSGNEPQPPAFDVIEGARGVYDLIRRAQR